MSTSPAAAWYPDPKDPAQLRWWDGSTWTPHTSPAPVPDPEPVQQRLATSTGTRNAKPKKNNRGWLVVAVMVGILTLGALLRGWSPVAAILVPLAVAALAIIVIAKGALPKVGLRNRRAGFAALGVAALLFTGTGLATAGTDATVDTSAAYSPQLLKEPELPAPKTTPSQTSSNGSANTARPTPKTTPTPRPKVTIVTEETAIPFASQTVEDPQLDQGVTILATVGVAGVNVTTYRVTSIDGAETSRTTMKNVVKLAPVAEVTAVGTRVPAPPPVAAPVPLAQTDAGGCDPNYAGACVPISSDVDCEGGGGNGPAYVRGPVTVVGSDIYKLDRDGDGIACD